MVCLVESLLPSSEMAFDLVLKSFPFPFVLFSKGAVVDLIAVFPHLKHEVPILVDQLRGPRGRLSEGADASEVPLLVLPEFEAESTI